MKIRKQIQAVLRNLGYLFLPGLAGLLCKSLKIEIKNSEVIYDLRKRGKNFIVAFWHGTMLVPWYLHKNENRAALVSQSRDGELLSKVLNKWLYKVIRGSSNTGGREALDLLYDFAKQNYSISITPDGPTGPPFKMKAGAVVTAKKTGLPLVLLAAAYKNKFSLNSWDQFQVPKPFSKVAVIYSNPIEVNSSRRTKLLYAAKRC